MISGEGVAGHDNRRPIHSKKRLKFPDDPRGIRLRNYLNFTLFTFYKIRILIQYLVAKIGMIISWLSWYVHSIYNVLNLKSYRILFCDRNPCNKSRTISVTKPESDSLWKTSSLISVRIVYPGEQHCWGS
ncbi:unnamed protein product [Rhizophagus irregularis]|nr:unnamed protein product [Rhizophagus irregularis]